MNLSTLPGTENLLIAVPLTPGPKGRFVFHRLTVNGGIADG